MLSINEMNKIADLMSKASSTDMKQIANLFNSATRMKSYQAASSFNVGDKVKWSGKRGAMGGTVQKVNRKNIVVDTGSMGKWNVSASLLKKA